MMKAKKLLLIAISLCLYGNSVIGQNKIQHDSLLVKAICDAAHNGDLNKVRTLLDTDSTLLGSKDNNGNSPLFEAISGNQVQMVEYLIKRGANLHEKKIIDEGLPNSVRNNNIKMATLLIKSGINVNGRSRNNVTPLHWAVMNENIDLVKLLLEYKAVVNSRDGYQQTPLHFAAIGGNEKVIKLLIDNGADVNAVHVDKYSSLHYLGWNKNIEGARILIKAGANVNAVSKSGETPLLSALKKGNPSLALLLLNNGATLGNKGEELLFATKGGYGKLVNELIIKGANINLKDAKGYTPLYYASKYGHNKISEVLLENGADKKQLCKTTDINKLLNEKVDSGLAQIWYTGQSGWIVRTASHILIFDYWESCGRPDEPSLANGYFNAEELNGNNIYMLISHSHDDHYDADAIRDIKKANPNVKLIYGFKPEEMNSNKGKNYNGPAYEFIGQRESKTIDKLEIHTLKSNDSGVAFLVKVDGLTIYHSGDHANRNKDIEKEYKNEVEFIANKASSVDIAFLGATGCGPWNSECVVDGFFYTVDILSAKVVLPMHGMDNEERYKKFAEMEKERNGKSIILCAENKGDRFSYRSQEANKP